ncbi:MAG TPA: alpha-ketoglutarate-dependent dioxygenase AlkB [Chryseosolibacter sp.]|nr:alpha-ketoglutarate-dependent dioxygenase AlkB [Chryseosolibacter sp.]
MRTKGTRHTIVTTEAMLSLFPEEAQNAPAGFDYLPEFLSAQEEMNLLEEIRKIPLHTFVFQGYEAKRKVASFGYDYSFDDRALSKGKPIPEGFHDVVAKAASALSLSIDAFAELLITEYPAGAVINWHRDAPPFDVIAGISLLSDCIFRFRPHEKMKQNRRSVISLPVMQRSLYVIKGAARSDWQHSIAPVRDVRYSITLRTLRKAME